jgi:hypothetical protein
VSRRALAALLVPPAVALAILAVGAGVVWSDLDPSDREAATQLSV